MKSRRENLSFNNWVAPFSSSTPPVLQKFLALPTTDVTMDIGIRCLRHHSHEFQVLYECISQ